MKIWGFAISLMAVTAFASPTWSQGKVKVEVEVTADDTVGRQFAFHVRDQIGRSGVFTEDQNGAIRLLIVTMDPDKELNSAGRRTIYSYTIVIDGGEEHLDSYLTSGVGYCGSSRVQSCAGTLFTTLGEQLETIRAALAPSRKNF